MKDFAKNKLSVTPRLRQQVIKNMQERTTVLSKLPVGVDCFLLSG
jgi:hypothetical protein